MNAVDVLAVLVVVGCVLSGMLVGFGREIWNLVSLVVGTYIAGRYYLQVADLLRVMIGDSPLMPFFAFGIIVAVISILLGLMAEGARRTSYGSQIQGMGSADRGLGGLAGLIYGVLAVELIATLLLIHPVYGIDRAVQTSRVIGGLFSEWPAILAILPESFRSVLGLMGV